MTRTFPIIAITFAMALFGFGCRNPGTIAPTTTQVIPTKIEPTVKVDPNAPHPIDQEGPSPEGLIARQALKNLSLAKTYRTSMVVPTTTGIIKTTASVNREQGLLGRLEIPSAQGIVSSEIYISGDTILFRENTSTWENISTTEEGKQFTNLFKNALAPESSDISLIVSDNTRTIETKDDPSGCKLYVLSQVNEAGERIPYEICIRNDIPSYISIQTAAGTLTTAFTDVNSRVEIRRPQ